jgi:hypothetical protein
MLGRPLKNWTSSSSTTVWCSLPRTIHGRSASCSVIVKPNSCIEHICSMFSAYGKRRFLALRAVDEAEAQRRLRGVLADVERGIWKEQDPPAPEPEGVSTFHLFAEQWWVRNEKRFAPKTVEDYKWRLECHVLPFFGELLDRPGRQRRAGKHRAAVVAISETDDALALETCNRRMAGTHCGRHAWLPMSDWGHALVRFRWRPRGSFSPGTAESTHSLRLPKASGSWVKGATSNRALASPLLAGSSHVGDPEAGCFDRPPRYPRLSPSHNRPSAHGR